MPYKKLGRISCFRGRPNVAARGVISLCLPATTVCVRASLSFTTQRTSQRDVHGKLRPHLYIHVLKGILPHNRSCLTENAVPCGSGTLLHLRQSVHANVRPFFYFA